MARQRTGWRRSATNNTAAMTDVVVVIGAGSIGQEIARRVSAGNHVLLADLRQENLDAAAKIISDAGFDVNIAVVDVSSRKSVHALVEEATSIGTITGVIHAAGVSPLQATPDTILKVDLYGTALRAGKIRQRHHTRRIRRRHFLAVRTPSSGADTGAGQGASYDAN